MQGSMFGVVHDVPSILDSVCVIPAFNVIYEEWEDMKYVVNITHQPNYAQKTVELCCIILYSIET